MNEYVIGTGFSYSHRYDAEAFASYWITHAVKFASPSHIFVIEHDAKFPFRKKENVTALPCSNLGHIHHLLGVWEPKMDNELCGFSAHILVLALIAYNAKKDFMFVEQDCLIFGNASSQIYQDCGEKGFVFGSYSKMPSAQSFFLVKHAFIPTWVREYLCMWADNKEPKLRTEHKFKVLEDKYSQQVGRLSFGVDRDRPIPWGTASYYAQQLSKTELQYGIEKRFIHSS